MTSAWTRLSHSSNIINVRYAGVAHAILTQPELYEACRLSSTNYSVRPCPTQTKSVPPSKSNTPIGMNCQGSYSMKPAAISSSPYTTFISAQSSTPNNALKPFLLFLRSPPKPSSDMVITVTVDTIVRLGTSNPYRQNEPPTRRLVRVLIPIGGFQSFL
ncbi:hypothetical protein C8Q74DRAFT_641288 [Fomes fomentarius]|nr:hypothetical protein C8Q74DRAFT_641288 [Fomes fomentarius]